MEFTFDFSQLDLIPSWFSISSEGAESYLSIVAGWFLSLIEYMLFLFDSVGFLWIIAACIFIVVMTRVVFLPIVGGRGLNLGSDRAQLRRRRREKE